MARARRAETTAGDRLSDRVALNVLLATFPPELVDDVLALNGRQQRSRSFPPQLVVYFVMAMCLFAGWDYNAVAHLLTECLPWARPSDGRGDTPTSAAISQARQRLGIAPLRTLFARVCRPIAKASTAGAWYRGWRMVVADSATFDVPDTPANVAVFGRTGGQGKSACPRMRVMAVAEGGTNAVFAVRTSRSAVNDGWLGRQLFSSLAPGMLIVVGRGFAAFEPWRAATDGTELLWQAQAHQELPVLTQLADGSYLSHIMAARHHNERVEPIAVRVVEYVTDKGADTSVHRLITTILDPEAAPAMDLASTYVQRWEFDTMLDELRIRQRDGRPTLRSFSPTGAEQEVYGLLLVHYAICALVQRSTPSVSPRLDRPHAVRVIPRQAPTSLRFPG
ncbi:IS4 family transposase [Rugosimonospora africana]|uniref:IS4 family transposase n=1 Tax=Rugosimonospora africana TaxID=556532 RepID=UPI0019431067|nr:IS4 family transposase [Rugosimonospora africana]